MGVSGVIIGGTRDGLLSPLYELRREIWHTISYLTLGCGAVLYGALVMFHLGVLAGIVAMVTLFVWWFFYVLSGKSGPDFWWFRVAVWGCVICLFGDVLIFLNNLLVVGMRAPGWMSFW